MPAGLSSWLAVVREAAPGARLVNVSGVPGGNFTDVFRLRLVSRAGSAFSLAVRLFRPQARPDVIEKLLVVLPLAAAAGVPTPKAVWVDDTGEVAGRRCIVFDWIPGTSFADAPEPEAR